MHGDGFLVRGQVQAHIVRYARRGLETSEDRHLALANHDRLNRRVLLNTSKKGEHALL